MDNTWKVQFAQGGQDLLTRAGLQPQHIFDDPRIVAWRDLPDRQNCYLDFPGGRLHIKRFKPPHGRDALREARAISLLQSAGIPTVPLVAHGTCNDGRGFLISEHLASYAPADRVLKDPEHRADLPERIADLATMLHRAHLHHRDLYLCHFFVPEDADEHREIHLIDPGRVARMPPWPLHYRWIVKDIAQLYYSVTDAGLPLTLRERIFTRYTEHASFLVGWICRVFVPLKASAIARHDRKLRLKRPGRRVSIDGGS